LPVVSPPTPRTRKIASTLSIVRWWFARATLPEALVDRPPLPQHASLERPLSDRLAGQPVCEPVEDSALGFALGAQQNVRWWRATGF
jgi:hypothetical protein